MGVPHQYVHSSTTQYTESLPHGYGRRPGVKPSLYGLAVLPARVALARSVPAASPGLIVRCWKARHPSKIASVYDAQSARGIALATAWGTYQTIGVRTRR